VFNPLFLKILWKKVILLPPFISTFYLPYSLEVEDKPSPAKKPKNIPDETTEPAKLEIKSSVKHKLPKELQVYFEKIASAVVSTEESLRVTAYQSLAEDPGLAQLLPYFVNFCSQKVKSFKSKYCFFTNSFDRFLIV
jgi:hypothetical protein